VLAVDGEASAGEFGAFTVIADDDPADSRDVKTPRGYIRARARYTGSNRPPSEFGRLSQTSTLEISLT
jgi:hypothetical protein